MARKPPKPKKWLVFIDTNILLDFYRLPGESAIRQLKALEKHRESLILGDQLSMEFLKNRQAAIVAGIQAMQKPLRPTVPSVLLDAQAAKTLIKNHGVTEKKWQESKKRIEKMLTNPSTSDPVYQHLMRIFDYDGDLNLKRTKKLRFTIRNLARKRFALGYPPRKHNATSLGDSINWEWIIHCAINSKDYHNVLIVSRDSDQTEQGASARDIERPMSHVPVHNGKPHVDWAFPNDGRDIRPGHEGKSATIGAADELAGRLPW